MSTYMSYSMPNVRRRHVEEVMKNSTSKYMTKVPEKATPKSPTKEVSLQEDVKV